MCLLRVVTEEAQTAKDTQLIADPIYVSVKLRGKVRHASTHLSTFTYREAPAISFLRFRIREVVFLDISTLLMRSFQPFGGTRACPDGDSVDIAVRSGDSDEQGLSWSARTRSGIVERVTASASNIERINRRLFREQSYLHLRLTRSSCIQSEENAKISNTRVLPPGRNSRDRSSCQTWRATGILPGDGSGPTSRTRRELLRSISSLRAASLASRVTYFVPTNIENPQRRLLPLWSLLSQGKI